MYRFTVRNRPITKAELEYVAGIGGSMLDRIYRNEHKPSDLEVTLANEALFYREWLELIFSERRDLNLGMAEMSIQSGSTVYEFYEQERQIRQQRETKSLQDNEPVISPRRKGSGTLSQSAKHL